MFSFVGGKHLEPTKYVLRDTGLEALYFNKYPQWEHFYKCAECFIVLILLTITTAFEVSH